MAVTINGTTGIAGVDGSASTPAVQGTDTNTGIFFPAADTIAFGEGGAEAMRITSSAELLIGTTTAASTQGANLQVITAAAIRRNVASAGSGALRFEKSRSATDGGYTIVQNDDNLGEVQFYGADGVDYATAASIKAIVNGTPGSDDMPGALVFSTTADGSASVTERARITSGGYFKASNNGTYSGSTGAYHEFVSTANGSNIEIRSTSAGLASGGTVFFSADRNTTNNTFYYVGCYNYGASAYKLQIADSGNVTNTNGTYGTISDLKLKQDITDATPQWDDIKNLRFRKYRFKSEVELDPNAKPFLGLVAQEAELVCPGLVEEHTDRDREDNDLGTTTKSIKTSILYMKAVKALQEAMARIETLEAQNATFEARLAALEAK
jgi:hypothetical protein